MVDVSRQSRPARVLSKHSSPFSKRVSNGARRPNGTFGSCDISGLFPYVESKEALILARRGNQVNALPGTLEFEAAKKSSENQARIRKLEDQWKKSSLEKTLRREVSKPFPKKLDIRYWNCGRAGN